ncbi:uncharacterized protein LOC129595890 [Paramacrobiotus metropolitanus]|uniref:uncharacterized protein LOC129595890 n=1 Tax=Paramacrobiotus metropolitanus TaxID=2943436 RepID=UPI002445D313|nr:uncharacterized protein LOC129595890 [Paramacrobiotus metropolitanus]
MASTAPGAPIASATLYIDLGTAYVRAAAKLSNGTVKYLEPKGHQCLPTYLSLLSSGSQSETFIGEDAKELSSTSLHNVAFYPTLFLRPEANPSWFGNGSATVTELLGKFLAELRNLCCDEIGDNVVITDCVITAHNIPLLKSKLLPAFSLTGFQRVAFKERQQMQMYGLLTNFPELQRDRTHLVVIRMGAAFTSLSVCELGNRQHKVTIVRPEEIFGGNDIDVLLMNHAIQEFEKLYEIRGQNYCTESLHRLRLKSEQVKIQLSTARAVTLQVRQFHAGCDLVVEFTVEKFREIVGSACYQLLRRVTDRVLNYIRELRKTVRYEVVLLGGTSKIPLIHEMVTWMMRRPHYRARSVMDTLTLSGMTMAHSEKYEEVTTTNGALALRGGFPFRSRFSCL